MVSSLVHPSAARAGNAPTLNAAPDGRLLTLAFSDSFAAAQDGEAGLWRAALDDSPRSGPRSPPSSCGLERHADWSTELRDPFAAAQGALKVSAVPASAERGSNAANYPYFSGLISTQPSFAQTYGYFEMRAQLPQGKGLWPAFWMLPQDGSWPPEIDVVESIGDPSRVYMTLHSSVAKTLGFEARITPNIAHSFAVSWDSADLIWYIDGAEVGRAPTPGDMHKPMFMLANLATGGSWTETATASPAKLMVDYIRAYRFER